MFGPALRASTLPDAFIGNGNAADGHAIAMQENVAAGILPESQDTIRGVRIAYVAARLLLRGWRPFWRSILHRWNWSHSRMGIALFRGRRVQHHKNERRDKNRVSAC